MAGIAAGYMNYGPANQKQMINGKEYVMYTPEWYAARDADTTHQSEVAGAAAGAGAKSAFSTQFPGYPLAPNGATTPDNPASVSSAANDSLDLLWRQQHGGAPIGSSGSGGGSGSSGASGVRALSSAPPTGQSGNPTATPNGFDQSSGGLWDRSAALDGLTAAAKNISAPLTTGTQATAPAQVSYNDVSGNAENVARANIFATTKDNAAKTASASLTGLGDALSARGLQGGGYEAGQIGGTLAREANTIGEGDRQEAESELTHEADVAHEKFQGAITQRGQDLSAQAAQRNTETQQAQLALQQRTASLAGLSAALNITSRGLY